MLAFDVYNVTFWNMVMAINRVEYYSCSLQVVYQKPQNNESMSPLLRTSLNMMKKHSIPLVLIEYGKLPFDTQHAWRRPTASLVFLLRYFRTT